MLKRKEQSFQRGIIVCFEEIKHRIDDHLTLFHFRRARQLIRKGIEVSQKKNRESLEYYFKAQLFIIDRKYKTALQYLNLSLSLDNSDSFCFNDKGICLAELHKYQESMKCFNAAIKINPDYPGFYQNKGWLYAIQGDYRKAVTCFFKALEFNCRRPDTLCSLGFCFEVLHDLKKAKDYYYRALRHIKGKSAFARAQIEKKIKTL